jgi:hypothetical protein
MQTGLKICWVIQIYNLENPIPHCQWQQWVKHWAFGNLYFLCL